MPLRHASATALAAALLVLTSCSNSEDPPEPLPTRSQPGTVDPPSSTPPTEVSLTDAPKGETAKQFIRRWVKLGNHMQATGDTEGFLAVSGPDCDSCHKFARQMKAIYDGGGYVDGGNETIGKFQRESETQWVVTRVAAPSEFAEKAGGPVKTFPGGPHTSRLYLAHVEGRWIVGATEGLAQ